MKNLPAEVNIINQKPVTRLECLHQLSIHPLKLSTTVAAVSVGFKFTP